MFITVGQESHFPCITENIASVYQKHKDPEDNFLYLVYSPENTFG